MANKKLTGIHRYSEFSEQTVAFRVKKMLDMREEITDVSNIHVKLSYSNRKTGATVPSVSLIPVFDCGRECAMCRKGCYDVRHVCCYKQSQRSRAENSALLKHDRARYFDEIQALCKFFRFFRWHVGGDIKDDFYLHEIVRIAEVTPTCEFLCFTKMYDIVNKFLDSRVAGFPSNLHIILSGWRGDTDQNPHNLPVSSPVWSDGSRSCMATDDAVWCPGDCSACAEINGGCWSARKGQTILFEAH